jgi:hypothetical protein
MCKETTFCAVAVYVTPSGGQIQSGEVLTVSNTSTGKTADKQDMCLRLDTWHYRLKLT